MINVNVSKELVLRVVDELKRVGGDYLLVKELEALVGTPKCYDGPLDNPNDFVVSTIPEAPVGFAPPRISVRITHRPTGITAVSSSERSAHANREKAWAEVKDRLKGWFEENR